MAALVAAFPPVIGNAVTSISVTNSVPVPAGATVCVLARAPWTTLANVTVTDTANGSYTRSSSVSTSGGTGIAHSFIYQNAAAADAGTDTITFTTDTSNNMRILGDAITGVAKSGGVLGSTGQQTNATGTSVVGTTIAGDPGGDVIWAGWWSAGGNASTQATPGSSNGAGLGIGQMLTPGPSGMFLTQWGSPTLPGDQASTLSWNAITNNTGAYLQILLAADTSADTSQTPALAGTFDPVLNSQAWF